MRDIEQASDEYKEALFKCMSKAMKMAKKDVVANSPENMGDYKRGWSIRTKRYKYGYEGVIYNKDFPGMTHLLEESHVIRNQYGAPKRPGAYKRTNPERGIGGKVHIAPAREAAEEYLIDLLMNYFE